MKDIAKDSMLYVEFSYTVKGSDIADLEREVTL